MNLRMLIYVGSCFSEDAAREAELNAPTGVVCSDLCWAAPTATIERWLAHCLSRAPEERNVYRLPDSSDPRQAPEAGGQHDNKGKAEPPPWVNATHTQPLFFFNPVWRDAPNRIGKKERDHFGSATQGAAALALGWYKSALSGRRTHNGKAIGFSWDSSTGFAGVAGFDLVLTSLTLSLRILSGGAKTRSMKKPSSSLLARRETFACTVNSTNHFYKLAGNAAPVRAGEANASRLRARHSRVSALLHLQQPEWHCGDSLNIQY